MKEEEILNQLSEENIDSMFVYKPENIKYISGFYPSSYAYLIIQEEPVLYVNSIDKESAEKLSQIETRAVEKLSEVKNILKGNIAVESSLEFGILQNLSDNIDSIKVSKVFENQRKPKPRRK